MNPVDTNASLPPSSDVRFYDFKFDSAPIQVVAEFYGKVVGKEVIVPSNCFDAFTFAPDRNLTKDEAVVMIEQNLKTAGLVMVHTNDRVELSGIARPNLRNSNPDFQQMTEERRQRLRAQIESIRARRASYSLPEGDSVPAEMPAPSNLVEQLTAFAASNNAVLQAKP